MLPNFYDVDGPSFLWFCHSRAGGNDKTAGMIRPFGFSGFTLIELLIVIVIISIVSTIAVLTIHANENKRLEAITRQLANTIALAQTEALLRPATIGFSLTPTSFQFYQYHIPTDPEESPWQPLQRNLSPKSIPKDIQINLFIGGKKITTASPALIISPNGDITPFKIYVGKKNAAAHYQIIGTMNGSIKTGVINED